MTIPSGLVRRPPTADDVPAVLALMAACDRAESERPDPLTSTPEDLLDEWKDLDLAQDAWLVTDGAGALAGYACIFDAGQGHFFGDAYVHPEFRQRGLGAYFVHCIEARAAELLPNAPAGARVSLALFSYSTNQPARVLFDEQGYRHVRSFWRMLIDLEREPAPARFPEGITLRSFVPGQDERALYDAVNEAFADHWGHVPRPYEEWLRRTELPSFDPGLWLLAVDGTEIAGSCLARNRAPLGFINSVAVRRPWRRRGLAMALLQSMFGECYRRGMRTVGLGVDSQNLTGATRLYEQAGMYVAVEFVRYEKELRAGEELAVQAVTA